MIEFIDTTKEYDDPKDKNKKIRALDEVCLTIKQSDFVFLVGASGAGKSTLIKMLICDDKPTGGRILVADRDITQIKSEQIPYYRRKIGVIFQDFKLLEHKTVYENIAFALEVCEVRDEIIRQRVPKILDMVGLSDRSYNYPDELSGGEQQRVAIARSLVHSPQIVVADEPTGNLDPQNTKEVLAIVEKINKAGATIIFATHDKEIVNDMRRRVITMRKGRIISDQKHGTYLE